MIEVINNDVVDSISGLVVVTRAHYETLNECERARLLLAVERQNLKYFVADFDNKKPLCLYENLYVKTPGTYYKTWDEVPQKDKDMAND